MLAAIVTNWWAPPRVFSGTSQSPQPYSILLPLLIHILFCWHCSQLRGHTLPHLGDSEAVIVFILTELLRKRSWLFKWHLANFQRQKTRLTDVGGNQHISPPSIQVYKAEDNQEELVVTFFPCLKAGERFTKNGFLTLLPSLPTYRLDVNSFFFFLHTWELSPRPHALYLWTILLPRLHCSLLKYYLRWDSMPTLWVAFLLHGVHCMH
jgi:hypothetical protein